MTIKSKITNRTRLLFYKLLRIRFNKLISHVNQTAGAGASSISNTLVDQYLFNGIAFIPETHTTLQLINKLSQVLLRGQENSALHDLDQWELKSNRIEAKAYRTSLMTARSATIFTRILSEKPIIDFCSNLMNKYSCNRVELAEFDIWLDGLNPSRFARPTETRLFHRDGISSPKATRETKIFILLKPIDISQGPFQLVTNSTSDKVLKDKRFYIDNDGLIINKDDQRYVTEDGLDQAACRNKGRYTERSVQKKYGESSIISFDGSKGLITFANTEKHLHRGLMAQPGKIRIMLAARFSFYEH